MKPQIVVYCCTNSTVLPEEQVEKVMSEQQASIKIVRLPCSGRTDVLYLLRAIEQGADMALIVGCPEGACRYLEGNLRAKMRVRYANRLLSEAGLGQERIRMINVAPTRGDDFAAALRETVSKAQEIGPWAKDSVNAFPSGI